MEDDDGGARTTYWTDSAHKYDCRMEQRNGVDVSLNRMAATGDPTRRNCTCDALGREPDTTGADSEAARAEKSSAKKEKKKKRRKKVETPSKKTRARGVQGHTRLYLRGSGIRDIAHEKKNSG